MIQKETTAFYSNCRLCPRECRVDRTTGEKGFCGETDEMRIASACLHFGEEPPLVLDRGSGTIFFTGCTLGCPFCQNRQISREGTGRAVTARELAGIMMKLQNEGALNINFVTGTPHIPHIQEAVSLARKEGLSLPLLWNCSGYETLETIKILETFTDIFLPDIKTLDPSVAERWFQCKDYPENAEAAVLRMAESRPLKFKGEQLEQGVILRHLVLPGEVQSSEKVLRWFAENLMGRVLISVMFQFTSDGYVRVTEQEYNQVWEVIEDIGLEEGFIQSLDDQTEWYPDFTRTSPFPSRLSKPVWHYTEKPEDS